MGEFPSEFLASKANQVGTRDHSDICQAELEDMLPFASIVDDDCSDDERPEDVDN